MIQQSPQESAARTTARPAETGTFDAVVIGAGFAGMYMLHRLRGLGFTARVYEAGGGVGGTWYWNRYPGARCDVESLQYSFSFSEELDQDWSWSEKYSPQPEILAYANHVADRFDLRSQIVFNTRVIAATFDEQAGSWLIETDRGDRVSAKFCIMAVGCLSAPNRPAFTGMADFRGPIYHTGEWPHEGVDFTGLRVGVIGTGSSAIQSIPIIAQQASELTVFQRTANWAAPLHNGKIDAETQARIKAGYGEIFARCKETFACFVHTPDPRGAFEVSDEEREAFYEKLYGERGFGIWQGNFKDILIDRAANATISDFVARKIRERVKNQAVAEKLIPKNHGFGTRRLPLETFYYEVYNRDNVELVDIKETPIERITPEGIRTTEKDYAFDIIIYATGFDAITGSFDKIDFRGAHGARLKEKWTHGPETYLGLMVDGFPNMMMLMGPHTALGNIPRSIEYSVDWVTGLLRFAQQKGLTFLDATPEGTAGWTDHVKALGVGLLSNEVDSWMTGINRNVEGKQRRIVARYSGSAPAYRARCDEVAATGYAELKLG